MAVELEGGCRVFGLREGEPERAGGLAVWRHVGRETGARSISLSALELEPGDAAEWQNGECEEALFVVAGAGQVVLDADSRPLRPLDGVFVRPGQAVGIRNAGLAPLTLLDSRCPDPGRALSIEARGRGSAAAPRGIVPVVRFEDQAVERAGDGRSFRVLVDAKVGCAQTTQFVGFIPPGRAPEHFHEYEEVVCILEGTGRFWSGASSAPVSAGSCLYLPRRQPHCVENTGEGPLSLYGLFYPSGSPSVRFAPGGTSG